MKIKQPLDNEKFFPTTMGQENVPQVRCYLVTRLCIGKTTLAAHLHRRNLAPELYYPWCSQQLFTTLVPSSRRLSNCNAYENKRQYCRLLVSYVLVVEVMANVFLYENNFFSQKSLKY